MVGQIFHQNKVDVDRKRRGFTIAEIIVVVVIIAVLAAISLVSYSTVQKSAQEASVRHDMRNVAKQVTLFKVDHQNYPSSAELQALGIHMNKQTYGVNPVGATIFYCTNTAKSAFSIVARVKSTLLLSYLSTTDQVTTYSGSATAPQLCLDSGVPGTTGTMDYTAFTNNGVWYSWVLN